MKTCTKCGLSKPETEYYKKVKGGGKFRSACKTCFAQRGKEHKAARQFVVPAEKGCHACKRVLPASSFAPSKLRVDGLNRYCRECFNERNRDRARERGRRVYREKPEQIKAINARSRAKNRERILEGKREYRRRNRERLKIKDHAYAQAHREQANRNSREWAKRNREKAQARVRQYRARKANCVSTLTAAEWKFIREAYGSKCLKCGATEKITLDHVIPIVMGGSNTADNVQPLCKSCNSKKHDKIEDYRPFRVEPPH
jgi:5-methylcytosine-specific restriction endonuclease McrA